MNYRDCHLTGKTIQLHAMRHEDSDALFDLAKGANIWQWYPDKIDSRQAMKQIVETALSAARDGHCIPLTISLVGQPNKIVGSSRFFEFKKEHRRAEIGWTFFAPEWQRTVANTESKYLMLQYGFEVLNLNRIELKTDSRNLKSIAAMKRIGFTQEGTLRSHMITHEGYHRDSIYFSAIAKEWLLLKLRIQEMMNAANGAK